MTQYSTKTRPPGRSIQFHEMERRQNDREFDIGPFRPTIKAKKNGKAAGLDNVVAELLKTDSDERTRELTKLFNKVKKESVAPIDSKVTKKGDLRE